MQLVPAPMPTNARIISPKGQPSPPQTNSEPGSTGQTPSSTRPATPDLDEVTEDSGFEGDWEEELDDQLHGQKFSDILSWDGVMELIDFDLKQAKKTISRVFRPCSCSIG